jgi:hypothetical protein
MPSSSETTVAWRDLKIAWCSFWVGWIAAFMLAIMMLPGHS